MITFVLILGNKPALLFFLIFNIHIVCIHKRTTDTDIKSDRSVNYTVFKKLVMKCCSEMGDYIQDKPREIRHFNTQLYN
jgi:hypothetical protein